MDSYLCGSVWSWESGWTCMLNSTQMWDVPNPWSLVCWFYPRRSPRKGPKCKAGGGLSIPGSRYFTNIPKPVYQTALVEFFLGGFHWESFFKINKWKMTLAIFPGTQSSRLDVRTQFGIVIYYGGHKRLQAGESTVTWGRIPLIWKEFIKDFLIHTWDLIPSLLILTTPLDSPKHNFLAR